MGTCSSNQELIGADLSKIPKLSYDGQTFMSRISPKDCYDGDTCWICIKLNNKLKKIKCRLANIDCPEMRPKKGSDRQKAIEKEKAIKARDELRRLVEGQLIKVKCGKFGKYGRVLVTLHTSKGICINDHLVEKGFAKKYMLRKK